MAIEIERKFLVLGDSWKSEVVGEKKLVQGYLANQARASVRVRIGGGKAHLNIKSLTLGVRRSEFEYEIPVADAEAMLANLVMGPCLEKTRYEVEHGGRTWEIDVFHGANEGLVVAELELESEHQEFDRPAWAGEDVSDDPKYYNVCLVERPYSTW